MTKIVYANILGRVMRCEVIEPKETDAEQFDRKNREKRQKREAAKVRDIIATVEAITKEDDNGL